MKKNLFLYACFTFFFVFIGAIIVAAGENEFSGGDGTPENPYLVATVEDLNNMRHHLDAHFLQTADINLNVAPFNAGEGWTPIGSYDINFTGTFDGHGYSIKNLYINRPMDNSIGLFAALGMGSSVVNLKLKDIDITGHNYVGGIVGSFLYGMISNSYSEGCVLGEAWVGGLVGKIGIFYSGGIDAEIAIVNSNAELNVSGIDHIGGLVGGIAVSSDNTNIEITIIDSYATGNIFGDSSVGGLMGGGGIWFVSGHCDVDISIINSFATGNVDGEHGVGGLVGSNRNTITGSYASGNVDGDYGVGGLVGNNSNTIIDSYASGKVSGLSGVGGLVGSNTNSGSVSDSYATGYVIGEQRVGGLVGSNYLGTIIRSCALGIVSGHSEVGGLVGRNAMLSVITNSYATGNVSGDEYVGGLVGYYEYTEEEYTNIKRSYAIGNITGNSWVGGLVGYNEDGTYGNVVDSFWDTDVGPATSQGGIGETTAAMMQRITFTGWDFNEVWAIKENTTYPYFRWQGDPEVFVSVTIMVEPAEGGVVTGGGNYEYGESVTLTAEAYQGYVFVNWTENGEGVSANEAIVFNAQGDRDLIAHFSEIGTYILSYSAAAGGNIDGDVHQTVAKGEDGTSVMAAPNTGYHFIEWSNGSNANPRIDANVTSDINVSAIFNINQYTVTFKDHDGTELDSQAVNHGSSATAPEDPNREGYTFTGWNSTFDSVTDNLTVTAQYTQTDEGEMPRRVLSGEDQEIDITSDSKIIGTGASETLNIYPNLNVDFTAGDGDRTNMPYELEHYEITSMGNHVWFSDTDANKVVTIIVTGTSIVGFVDGSTAKLEMVFSPGGPPQVQLGGAVVGPAPLDHDLVELWFESGPHPDKITNSIGMTFNYIEPGTFMMGSPEDEPGFDLYREGPQHQVTLTQGYHMQTTPVTQGQWEEVMSYNPSEFDKCGRDCPVERVSWNDVQAFIRALNDLEGTDRYALPTEAQWEYAARAGSTTAFANGDITPYDDMLECNYDNNLDAIGWYCNNSNGRTHPVAQKDPNAWGLYDVHGNVWEWVAERHDRYPFPGDSRVMRGGSYVTAARWCRSAFRLWGVPHLRYSDSGFRLILIMDD